MDIISFFPLAVAVFILMLKPGPVMITCMSLAFEGRWKSIISFWTGYLVVRTFMYFFLLSTLQTLPEGFGIVFLFFKAIASILFITLGIKGLQTSMEQASAASTELKERILPNNLRHNFFMGGVLQVSNPYDYVFILAVIPSLMGTTEFSFSLIAMINIVVIILDVAVNAAYVLPILYFREKFLGKETLAKIKTISSVLLIFVGIYIFSTIFLRGEMVDTQLLSPDMSQSIIESVSGS